MRNRITHDYGHVDFRIVWEVTKEHIAPLIAALEQHFLPEENSRSAAPEPPSTKRPPVN
jgi:uncharacterized protein with HEPN domain